ncbi:hypothetical protein [Lishizhenia sp.]|uniref:hypothetical protein n=1 Tax=Lishizhenia sp. TaxID=2497594 RepID=UPI00299DE4D9|nr:hypothetical protein [Lishizhenia sp.]MDX1446733.1 hypothetical protein [Lishizhenia sp.]
MDELLEETSELAEIVIHSYTYTIDTLGDTSPLRMYKSVYCMQYSYSHQPDSIFKYIPQRNSKYGWVLFAHQDSILSQSSLHQGFWPRVNDTVFVFFDFQGEISLFGRELTLNRIQLWSPYQNSSWTTLFYACAPFEQDNSGNFNPGFLMGQKEKAKEKGYDLASVFYLLISRKDLDEIKSIRTKPK